MIKIIKAIWDRLIHPRGWDFFVDTSTNELRVRRWVNGAWEYREPTEKESEDHYWSYLIR